MKLPTAIAAVALTIATGTFASGCGPTPTPTQLPAPSTSVATPSAPSSAPIVTPTPSANATSVEDAIRRQIEAYIAWNNKAFADPSVPTHEAGRYTIDVEPDLLLTAVQQNLVKFRTKNYKETGDSTVTVDSIEATGGGRYKARVCLDTTKVTVTDANGQVVDTGPKRGAADYTMTKAANGLWMISKIQGVGTC